MRCTITVRFMPRLYHKNCSNSPKAHFNVVAPGQYGSTARDVSVPGEPRSQRGRGRFHDHDVVPAHAGTRSAQTCWQRLVRREYAGQAALLPACCTTVPAFLTWQLL